MAEWDDDNFEPLVETAAVALSSNKWVGEDEEDEVKESWEDEEEEKKAEENKGDDQSEAYQKAKKKSLQERIAEKERLRQEEHERRLREGQDEDISPEEQLRRQKESDLHVALETTFGGSETNSGIIHLESTQPSTKEEFDEFVESLTKVIQPCSKSEEYPVFAENLIRNVCATLSSFDIKKIKTTIDNLYLEKQKIEKGDKSKKSKGKGKAKLKMEGDNLQLNQYSAYVGDYDEFDDFM